MLSATPIPVYDRPAGTRVSPLSPCTVGTSPLSFNDFRNFASVVRGCNLALKCATRFISFNRALRGKEGSRNRV